MTTPCPDHHALLWEACKKLPEDYDPWGQNERWSDPTRSYPDCSNGCRFAYWLEARDKQPIGMDWCVCGNPVSHRYGLLTFEHQGCQHAKLKGERS
jgi:hypothetical protein